MRLMLTMVAAALAAVLPVAATAEQQITDFRLDNGMEVVVIEDHRAQVVTQMVWYRVGSADGIRCDTDGNIWSSAGWVGACSIESDILSPSGRVPKGCGQDPQRRKAGGGA